jgi:hypothetical protein
MLCTFLAEAKQAVDEERDEIKWHAVKQAERPTLAVRSEPKEAPSSAGGDRQSKRVDERQAKLIDAVQAFLANDAFYRSIEKFCLARCHLFGDDTSGRESSSDPVTLYRLEYGTVYQEFTALVEGKIESHLKFCCCGAEQFVQALAAAGTGGRACVRSIEAAADFDVFVSMMMACKTDGGLGLD